MKSRSKSIALLTAASPIWIAPAAFSATIIPMTSFDPATYFSGGFTAGIDFDDASPTQSGFLGIPASNNKSYLVTTGGITFDIDVINANQANQNRDRGASNSGFPNGDLVRDFEQWYGRNAAGGGVEATITLTGLAANTDYQLTFFTYNVGAGQSTHSFYEGTSSAAPLITTFTTSGSQTNPATWVPGITFQINSGNSSQISVTIQAPTFNASGNIDSRLTLNGMTVTAVPEPASAALLALGGIALFRRRRP